MVSRYWSYYCVLCGSWKMVNFGNFFSDFHPRWVKFWLNSPRIKKTSSVQRSCFREFYGHWQRFWRQIWILVSLLDSCYMRSMTDVCSMFENWTRAGSAQRGGLKIGFTLGGGWNSPTQRAVANVIGLGLELVMNGALFYALVGNVIDVINFRYVMHDKYIDAEQKFYVW